MVNINLNTRFVDMAVRERRAYDAHVNTIARLTAIKEKRPLSTAEQAELDLSAAIKKEVDTSSTSANRAQEVCDPLFVGLRTLLNDNAMVTPELHSQVNGVLVFEYIDDQPLPEITTTALTFGLLSVDAATPPPV